ncbi:MAG: RpiB/LacA/LacB family sugar-phosphate isomerase [Planctomycetota bacterium]|nr:RpiB/LacA/LacB family sugar-phosphate isomerase [Planctomycetota bacterium]MDG2144508.1 RpiB/LacA/LacB family sugar-phosphate isomerase [Planctomycetota bacterium]
MKLDPRQIARRALGRAMTQMGGTATPDKLPRGGVHVSVSGASAKDRPGAPGGPGGSPKMGLVTAGDLAELADESTFDVPMGAAITDMALDEANRRGITLRGAIGHSGDPIPDSRESGPLRIAIGADHGGYALKCDLIDWIRDLGHLPIDLGCHGDSAVDYPDFAEAVADAVRSDRCSLGVCIDGAGIGSTMAANKVPGIRAANCYDVASAQNAREHNYANVLCLGGPRIAPSAALEILRAFLTTPWGAERHGRRVEKITRIEQRHART